MANSEAGSKLDQSDPYNALLTAGRIRRFYHEARFMWAQSNIARLVGRPLRLVELGCYDGKLLDILGGQVSEYVGLDANWGGGLDRARRKYEGQPGVSFLEASRPDDLAKFATAQFNAAASLETLEHVLPEHVPGFLDQLQRITAGYCFVTVPNELGPVFLGKFLLKHLFYGGNIPYSRAEIIAATLRNSQKIDRLDHKGFDYRHIVSEMRERFEIVKVQGLAAVGLPLSLCPTVGIIGKTKSKDLARRFVAGDR